MPDTRTAAGHAVWTNTITQRVLFGGQCQVCETQEFRALKEGFDYQLQEGSSRRDPTLLQVSIAITYKWSQH